LKKVGIVGLMNGDSIACEIYAWSMNCKYDMSQISIFCLRNEPFERSEKMGINVFCLYRKRESKRPKKINQPIWNTLNFNDYFALELILDW